MYPWCRVYSSIVVSVFLSSLALAQESAPGIDQVWRAWKAREDKSMTARFELTGEDTIPKGANSLLASTRGPVQEVLPPEDLLLKGVTRVSLSGGKLRHETNMDLWDSVARRFYPSRHLDVFDGEIFKSLDTPESTEHDYGVGVVQKAKVSRSSLNFPILPLIVAFRGTYEQYFRQRGEFTSSGRSTLIAGRPCLELVKVPNTGQKREVLYVDRERDYVVVREITIVGEQPTWQLDVTYTPDSGVGWVPHSWEYIIRTGKGIRCRSPSKTCVSAYYYPVPATGLTLGRMVLTLAFECWVFADYLPSSFVRGRLASLTSQLVTALHPIDSVVPLTFALAPSASSTCRLCPGCLLVLMPSGPAATAASVPANELSTTSRKKPYTDLPCWARWRSPSRFARSTAGPVRSASLA